MKKEQVSKKGRQLSNLIRQKILGLFYENPSLNLTVRKMAEVTKINRSTLQYHLSFLKNEGIIDKNNHWIDSWENKLKKINYYTEKIAESGLIDHLHKELASSAIILFGSVRKGESVKGSDIDIFVECGIEKQLNLKKFEKKIGHKVQLFTKPKITNLPKHLLNNVVNGIKLKGYFTIK